MCLVFLWRAPAAEDACDAWERELAKRYRLVIASNRDEILSRPADRLGRWSDNEKVVGGRDLCGIMRETSVHLHAIEQARVDGVISPQAATAPAEGPG